jgi:ribonucleotide reductase, class II
MTTIDHPNVNTKFATKLPDRIVNMMREETVPFGPIGLVTYKRTYARQMDNGRKENYADTLTRCLNGLLHIGGAFTLRELEVLAGYLIQLKCNFSGRALWQLGTSTVDRLGGDSLQACWHTRVNEPILPFCFAFEQLMLGGGVGFSVMPEDVYEIPTVKHNVNVNRVDDFDCDFIVPDNREGWVELLKRILEAFYFTGKNVNYNPDCLRAKGELIKSFGGTASGSMDLISGISDIVKILKSRHSMKLRPIDAMDIMNIIGKIVVAGNVRRSAEIACGSGRDRDFLLAKYWANHQIIPAWRQMSNNTVKESIISELLPEFWWGYEADPETGQALGEPYGLYNPYLVENYHRLIDPMDTGYNASAVGPNPCVPGSTWVHTTEGPKQVCDLFGQPFQAVVNGTIHNSNGEGFFHTGKKEVFRIETDRGFFFEGTADHKLIRASNDGEGMPIKIKDLLVGDKLQLHNHRGMNHWPGVGTFDEGTMLGSLLGDGTWGQEAKLSFWGENKEWMRDHYKELIKSKFGGKWQPSFNDIDSDPNKPIHLSSIGLSKLARDYGLEQIKELDFRIEMKSSDFYRGFLRGWFDADGSVQGTIVKGISVRLSSVILENLVIAQRMLGRLGIISTVYKNRREAGYRELPNGQGGWATYWCQATHELVIAKDNINHFQKEIGFYESDKAEKLEKLIKQLHKRGLYKEKFKTTITAINSIGVKDVFCCSIPTARLFDGNGFVTRNCGEICLSNYESCNLGELYLTNLIDGNQFHTAAELMIKVLKTISTLPFLYDRTNAIVKENHRLGLGVTGVMAAHHLRKSSMFDSVYKHIKEVDKEYSSLIGVKTSIALTTVKPSGTLAKLPDGCTPGANPGYSQYNRVLITFASNSSMLQTLKEKGYPMEPKINLDGSYDYGSTMVGFPVSYPDGTPTEDITAIEQLENVVMLQTFWSDNAVSATIQFEQHEVPAIKAWLYENYGHHLKTISFCRRTGHNFKQPPNTPLSKEDFDSFRESIEPIVDGDFTFDCREDLMDGECVGGNCGVR